MSIMKRYPAYDLTEKALQFMIKTLQDKLGRSLTENSKDEWLELAIEMETNAKKAVSGLCSFVDREYYFGLSNDFLRAAELLEAAEVMGLDLRSSLAA